MSSPWTLEEAQEHLKAWMEAEKSVAQAQSYTIGSRSLTRANVSEIRSQIQFWRREITILQRGKRQRITRIVPRDL